MLLEEELSLVVRAKAGEKAAMSALYDTITPKLYGYLVNVLRDKVVAEDILQEVWIKAITSLAMFRPQGVRFSAWLFAIARNECRTHWRKKGREVGIDDTHVGTSSHVHTEEKVWVDMVIGKLSLEDQEILRLRYLADLSFKEVARVLNISLISARVRVHRALQKANTMSPDSSSL